MCPEVALITGKNARLEPKASIFLSLARNRRFGDLLGFARQRVFGMRAFEKSARTMCKIPCNNKVLRFLDFRCPRNQ